LDDYTKAKEVTADLVNGRPVGLYSRDPWKMDEIKGYQVFWGQPGWRSLEEKVKSGQVSSFVYVGDESFQSSHRHVQLYPRKMVVGVGCKKNTGIDELEAGIKTMLKTAGFSRKGVGAIASAWIKADEEGLKSLASKWQIPFVTFEKDEIAEVEDQFIGSDFVKETIGVSCVSEPCGYLASKKGTCRVSVIRENGMTLSLWQAKEEIK
jgi:cobalt-precorrin 5A hydrolase